MGTMGVKLKLLIMVVPLVMIATSSTGRQRHVLASLLLNAPRLAGWQDESVLCYGC